MSLFKPNSCFRKKAIFDAHSLVSRDTQPGVAGFFLVASICLLLFAQGGFYNLATSLFGIAICLAGGVLSFRHSLRGRPALLTSLPFLLLACAYLASACMSGPTLTVLSETGVWFGVAGIALLAGIQTESSRNVTVSWLSWTGIATSIFGVLIYTELVLFPGGMNDGRLQFTFQYANAAGIWFAAVAALCALSPSGRLRSLAPLPIAALLLTQSGGAILVSALALVVGVLCWCKTRQYDRLFAVMCQVVAALLLFCFLYFLRGATGALLFAASGAALFALGPIERRIEGNRHTKSLSLVLLGIAATAAAALLLLFPERLGAAAAGFVERLYHIADGIALWTDSPLLGVGPDNWQFLYPYAQTAQYHTTVVHGSYVQIALDSGMIGLGLLVAAIAIGTRNLLGSGRSDSDVAAAVAVLLVAVHSLIDFDLQFGAIAFLAAFLLSTPRGPRVPVKGIWLGLACLIVGVSSCFVGVLADASKASLSLANATGDYGKTQELFEGNALAQKDVFAQTEYLAALYAMEDYDAIEGYCGAHGVASDEQAVYASVSLYELGDARRAGEVLIEQMEAQPYNDEFYKNAKTIIDAYGLEADLKDRYNAAVANANGLAASSSRWLPAQEILNTYVH